MKKKETWQDKVPAYAAAATARDVSALTTNKAVTMPNFNRVANNPLHTPEEFENLRQSIHQHMGVPTSKVTFTPSKPTDAKVFSIPGLEDVTHHISAPTTNAAFYAHELGHASQRPSVKRALGYTFGRSVVPSVGGVVGTGMAVADPDSTVAKLAPAAVLAGHVPILADEGIASYRGLKAMKATGLFTPEQLKQARKGLLAAYGTYAGNALAAAAGIGGFVAGRRYLKHRNDPK